MMHYTDLLTDIDSETHIELSLKCNVVLRICFIFSVHLLTTLITVNQIWTWKVIVAFYATW